MPDATSSVLLVHTAKADERLEAALTLDGLEVVGCYDTETLELLLQENFAMIVAYLHGPSCLGVLRHIAEAEKGCHLLALVAGDACDWDETLRIGADQIVDAAADMPRLVAQIAAAYRRQEEWLRLQSRRDRLQRALEATRDGLWDWDLITNKMYYSWAWRLLLGLPPGDVLESPDDWFNLVHADDLGALRSRLAVHIEGVTPFFEYQCRMRTFDGTYKWVLTRGMAARDADGTAIGITGTMTDLTQRSHHDMRTGLPFRSFFVDRLNQAIVQTQLTSDRFFSVLQVDMDRITTISEGFGHDMVDSLLVAMSRRMETCLGPGDTLAFLGGNSFVILVEDQKDLKIGRAVANQIHMQLIAPFRINDTDVFSRASIGITLVDGTLNNPNEILRQAQGATKAARKLGTGHSHVFDRAVAGEIHEYLHIESALRTALDREAFELYYQPQVCMVTGRILGVETLLRWKDADGAFVSPGKFIPIAEETDLILTIGEWVLRGACKQAVAWQKAGLPPLRVGVNLSERQFRARNLVGTVDQVLRETGLQPENLELEITESIFMENAESTFEILHSLRERGLKIALDDFGTGFSSLSYLKRFPLTTLKIDRAFITDLTSDAGDAAICSTIVSLGHKFNFTVIAEGVETKEQLIILRAFQCDEVQGFYYSKALPAAKFEELYRKQLKRLERRPGAGNAVAMEALGIKARK